MNKRIASVLVPAAALLLSSVLVPLTQVDAQFQLFGAQRAPALDVDRNGKLYLLMSVATKSVEAHTPGSQIFITTSKDGGATWDNMPLTRNLSKSDGEAFGPSVAVTKTGAILPYVVYHDNVGGPTQVYLLRTKKKTKFKKAVNITPDDEGAFTPKLALDLEENLNLVWGDTSNLARHVVFLRSTDQGASFSSPRVISGSSVEAFDPEIASVRLDAAPAGFAIYVVWDDRIDGQRMIMFSRSLDAGQTFSQPRPVSKGPSGASECHIAAEPGGRIHVAWVDTPSAGESAAFYSRSTNGGDTFSEPVNLSRIANAEVHKTAVVASNGRVFVAFNEDARTKQVFLATSEDAGVSFSDPVQVSNADPARGRGHSAAMVIDPDGLLHIVWIDSSVLSKDEGLLFYTNTSNGRRFESKRMILAFVPTPS